MDFFVFVVLDVILVVVNIGVNVVAWFAYFDHSVVIFGLGSFHVKPIHS